MRIAFEYRPAPSIENDEPLVQLVRDAYAEADERIDMPEDLIRSIVFAFRSIQGESENI